MTTSPAALIAMRAGGPAGAGAGATSALALAAAGGAAAPVAALAAPPELNGVSEVVVCGVSPADGSVVVTAGLRLSGRLLERSPGARPGAAAAAHGLAFSSSSSFTHPWHPDHVLEPTGKRPPSTTTPPGRSTWSCGGHFFKGSCRSFSHRGEGLGHPARRGGNARNRSERSFPFFPRRALPCLCSPLEASPFCPSPTPLLQCRLAATTTGAAPPFGTARSATSSSARTAGAWVSSHRTTRRRETSFRYRGDLVQVGSGSFIL